MKTAFLFPGQGAQVVEMGRDIALQFDIADKIFSQANEIVGFDLKKLCFEGPAEELNTTTVSQPAIFTTSVAILEVLRQKSPNGFVKPDVTAGLSLGEYTALYAAGVINFEDGLRLVAKRGQAMQQAADASDGAMVSIIGLDEQKVAELCKQAAEGETLVAVNFNCPGQIVVSGTTAACQRAEQLAADFGAMKAVKLAVAGAFHSDMMQPAADDLKLAFEQSEISDPSHVKIIANINADYYQDANSMVEGLLKQLTSPILWQKCMEKLLADGVEDFYEIGPGRVLTGLMRRINRKTRVKNISSLNDVNNLLDS